MTLRIILLIVGILVILAIALDGWWRKRQRRNAILRAAPVLDAELAEQKVVDDIVEQVTQESSLQKTLAESLANDQPGALHIRQIHENNSDEKDASNQALPAGKKATDVKSANEAIPKKDSVQKRLGITAPPSEVITLTMMAANDRPFAGYDLIKALDDNFLHFGEYDIYHRHKYKNGKGPLYFSVASIVKPGTIDPKSVAAISTPGLALFMRMDNPKHDRVIFKQMLAIAHDLAAALNGVVCDDKRVPLREATLKFYSEKLKL